MLTPEEEKLKKQKFLADSIISNNLSKNNFLDYIKGKKENGIFISTRHR